MNGVAPTLAAVTGRMLSPQKFRCGNIEQDTRALEVWLFC